MTSGLKTLLDSELFGAPEAMPSRKILGRQLQVFASELLRFLFASGKGRLAKHGKTF
jgi:hypothetical protein